MDDISIFDLQYVLSSCSALSPDEEEELRGARPTLNLLNVKYEVSEKVGPWWKGACLRKSKTKTVIRDFTGQFRGGEIIAILGSSGSGKTSLLDIIACRTSGKVSGKVYYNNYECTKEVIKQYAAYVMQADRLLANLTVRETLQFAAFLRLPGRTTRIEIEEKVNKVIQEMGLKNVADSKIGGTVVRGISGGERRRVTIAIQLLQDPKILLLDEPTTGLDSYTARYLVSNLADIAHNTGKLVILTIHQPRSELFKLFDKVGLLSMGEQVFLGNSSEMVEYFANVGFPCPTYSNPLDFYVDLASIDRRNLESEFDTTSRVKGLVQKFSMSDVHSATLRMVMEETMKPSTRRTLVHFYKPRPPNIFRIIWALVGRMMVNLGRDRTIYISRVFLLSLFVPFVCTFLGHMKNTQESIQDRVGLMYQSLSVPPYVAILNGVALFPPIRDTYYREARDGLYGTTAFMLAYVLHIVPFTLFSSFVFSIIVYWVTGLYPEWHRFGIYYAVVFVLHLIGEIMTVGCMGVFQNGQIANSTITLILTASILFSSGLLRSLESMLEIFHWASWFTVHKYSTEILVANEFHGSNFTCEIGQDAAPCQFRTGDDYLQAFYPDAIDNNQRNFGALGGFILSFLTVTIIAFKIRGIPNLN